MRGKKRETSEGVCRKKDTAESRFPAPKMWESWRVFVSERLRVWREGVESCREFEQLNFD
ncbi:hypothetical protein ASG21_11550 [Chryseobacterium sp. Leaf394]|nr:hypothetical protein ASG21_11550 [Chryseobacterium sp. Leaf394]